MGEKPVEAVKPIEKIIPWRVPVLAVYSRQQNAYLVGIGVCGGVLGSWSWGRLKCAVHPFLSPLQPPSSFLTQSLFIFPSHYSAISAFVIDIVVLSGEHRFRRDFGVCSISKQRQDGHHYSGVRPAPAGGFGVG